MKIEKAKILIVLLGISLFLGNISLVRAITGAESDPANTGGGDVLPAPKPKPAPVIMTPEMKLEMMEKARIQAENSGQKPKVINLDTKQDVMKIQQDKKMDVLKIKQETGEQIKDLRQDAKLEVKNNKIELKGEVQASKKDGLTVEEKAMLKMKAEAMRLDNANIRQDAKEKIILERQTGFEDIKERREEAREDIKKILEERKAKIASSTDERKDQLQKNALERLAKNVENVVKRLTTAIERIEKLSARIQSRVDKIKAAGGNTTTAETELANATIAATAAKNGIANISSSFANIDPNADIKAQATALKESTKAVNDNIKTANEALRKAVNSLHGQMGATTTASVVIQSESNETN